MATLSARQRVLAMETNGIEDHRRLVLAALLDHLHAPGLQTIEGDIIGCVDDQELTGLADHYIYTVFKPSTSVIYYLSTLRILYQTHASLRSITLSLKS